MLSVPIDLFHNNEQENRNFQNNVKNKSKSEKKLFVWVHIWHKRLILGGLTPLYNRRALAFTGRLQFWAKDIFAHNTS